MGNQNDQNEFQSKMKMTIAEYFATKVVMFSKDVVEKNQDLDKDVRFLPENLDEEIKRGSERNLFAKN